MLTVVAVDGTAARQAGWWRDTWNGPLPKEVLRGWTGSSRRDEGEAEEQRHSCAPRQWGPRACVALGDREEKNPSQ